MERNPAQNSISTTKLLNLYFHLNLMRVQIYGAWVAWYVTLCSPSLACQLTLHKIYELVFIESLAYFWCDTKDDVVDEWISAFGDLPEEWKSHCPPRTADCEQMFHSPLVDLLLLPHSNILCLGLNRAIYNTESKFRLAAIPGSFSISNGLQLDLSAMIPGTQWFSKPSLDALGDLLTSMTQYHPSDRPSATQVLQHPWFQRCPSFIHIPVPTEEEQALADLETLKSLNLDPKTVIVPTCLER